MSAPDPKWFVLGFTSDDVITAGQDSRLACECVKAWQAAGRPPEFEILQTPGEGGYFFSWFVSESSAELLDHHQVPWRRFLVGHCPAPPANARQALTEESMRQP
jgi:hypothetical protein